MRKSTHTKIKAIQKLEISREYMGSKGDIQQLFFIKSEERTITSKNKNY